jgi:hypothetical protein
MPFPFLYFLRTAVRRLVNEGKFLSDRGHERACPMAAGGLLLLVACTVGPEYRCPDTAVEEAGAYENAPESLSHVTASNGFSRWWPQMEDPLMGVWVDRLWIRQA